MKFYCNVTFLVGLVVTALFSFPAVAKDTIAKQALLVDGQTGQVLLDKNADQRMPTSSMSKVMTIYMVFDALKNGVITLDTELRVSEKAWRKGGSKMFVEEGKKVRVEDLVRGVIIQSGNDATIVLAEGLAGDEDAFALRMTEKAKSLGMTASNFKNASGWPDPDHYSTAKDLVTLSQHMIKDFPRYYKYYSEKEFEYNEIKQPNRNPLLFQNIGADGLKTGHTEAGGYGLMGTAKQDGRRVFLVLNGLDSEKTRAQESKRLMLWALNSFSNRTAVEANKDLGAVEVLYANNGPAVAVSHESITVTVPRLKADKSTVSLLYKENLEAPIKKGAELGTLTIEVPDMENITRPIYAAADVERKGFFGVALEQLKAFFLSLLDKI